MCGVREESAVGGGEFGASVNRCGNGLAIEHLSTVKNLQSVMLLAKKETGCGGGDIDAQEMMKVTQVTHGEFRLKGSDDGVECVGGVGGKNNIVNIHKEIGNGCTSMDNV